MDIEKAFNEYELIEFGYANDGFEHGNPTYQYKIKDYDVWVSKTTSNLFNISYPRRAVIFSAYTFGSS